MTPYQLGRHVEHDPRSKQYPATTPAGGGIWTVDHKRHGFMFDQGRLGSCTGNALAAALMTDPLYFGARLNEATAVKLYEMASKLDNVKGNYPPNDTGSTGLAVCKAAKALGYLTGYKHAFGLEHALAALTLQPVIAGILWYESMFEPDANGVVSITPGSEVAGGHEIALLRLDVERQMVGFDNSWGRKWGQHGRGWMTFDTFDRLLHERGDVTVPERKVA